MPATTFSHAGFRRKAELLLSEPVVGAPGAGTVARSSVESMWTLQRVSRIGMQKRATTHFAVKKRQGLPKPTTAAAGTTVIVVSDGNYTFV